PSPSSPPVATTSSAASWPRWVRRRSPQPARRTRRPSGGGPFGSPGAGWGRSGPVGVAVAAVAAVGGRRGLADLGGHRGAVLHRGAGARALADHPAVAGRVAVGRGLRAEGQVAVLHRALGAALGEVVEVRHLDGG